MAYDDDLIRSSLRAHWHVRAVELAPVTVGGFSLAWTVTDESGRYLARLFSADSRQSVEAGLAAVEHLPAFGVAAGEPVRTLAGTLTAATPAGALGLVRRVTGRPLDGADPLDQQWWGDRLGAAHKALAGFRHRGVRRWNSLQPDAGHPAVEPWLRRAVADAAAAMTRLTVTDRLTYGMLHGDPAPSAFFVDPESGRTGVVDWGPCTAGPLVYDLAAAAAYAGGLEHAAELIDGYAAAGPVPLDEIEAALPVLLRFRWAVQADFFARRIARRAAAGSGRAPGRVRDAGPACDAGAASVGVPGDPAADRAGLYAARDALAALAAEAG